MSGEETDQSISSDADQLEAFNTLLHAGSIARSKGADEIAETFYRAAIEFSVDNWGPYKWPEAKALLLLSDLYSSQDRHEESEVLWLLSCRIVRKKG
ncbi:MAG: hypothetical protein AB7W16_03130 [Candidatus Obscuribacterales bacterium]